MTKSSNDKLFPVVQQLQDFATSQQGSITLLRILGYGLLVLALFDLLETLTPPNFMNPVWEFQTQGTLVERVPVTLIGLVLVFYGEQHSRYRWEIPFLKFLTWLTLLFAVLFLLFIPLGIVNTIRLNKQSVSQINTVSSQQISRAQELEKQLGEVTPTQIDKFLKIQGRSLDGKKPEDFKNKLLVQVSKAKEKIKIQAEATQSLQGLNLLKTSVKWNLGALVSGVLFISIWKLTYWARQT